METRVLRGERHNREDAVADDEDDASGGGVDGGQNVDHSKVGRDTRDTRL